LPGFVSEISITDPVPMTATAVAVTCGPVPVGAGNVTTGALVYPAPGSTMATPDTGQPAAVAQVAVFNGYMAVVAVARRGPAGGT
jgi:hypothetical protein